MNTHTTRIACLAICLYLLSTLTANAQFIEAVENPFGLMEYQEGNFVTPIFVDFDSDGDQDMITTMGLQNQPVFLFGPENSGFEYWENTGDPSNPNFVAPVWNPFGLQTTGGEANSSYSNFGVSAGDLDGDGDIDLLSLVAYPVFGVFRRVFKYYENVGSGGVANYSLPIDNAFGLSSNDEIVAFHLSDVDGDGDLDLLHTEFAENDRIFVRENIGSSSSPQYAESIELIIETTSGFGLINKISTGDLDGDGDEDILCGVRVDGEFRIYENLGSATYQEIASEEFDLQTAIIPHYPTLVDLDNDEDLDIVSATRTESSPDRFNFLYFENLGEDVSADDGIQFSTSLKIGPNPVQNQLTISSTENSIKSITLYDAFGRALSSEMKATAVNQIDVSHILPGIFISKVVYENGLSQSLKLVKQ